MTPPEAVERTARQGRSAIVAEALAFQKLSSEAFFDQRTREEKALEFQVPENQWPDDVKAQRQGQSVQGVPLPARPMLSIPILDQPIQLQLNQEKSAHLGVQVHPLSEDATDDTADILQGVYRHIEVESRAGLARSWAFDRAVKAGWGVYRVNVVYDDASDDPRDLTIRIDRILHQSSVFLDPYAQQPDWSDGTRALIVSYVPWTTYTREYPTSTLQGYGDDELSQLATDYPFWINGTGESRAVCVAEYFYTTYRDRNWAILSNGAFAFEDDPLPEGVTIVSPGIRPVQWPEVRWCKLNAVEELDAKLWNGRYIPLIPVIGKELQPFTGERIWMGMIEPNMDAARLVNYEVSNAVEKDALAPKAPYVGAVGQFKTMRKQWDQANVRNFSTLEYDPVAAGGQLAPPPQRNMVSADLTSALQLVDLARNLVQLGTSTTDSAALEQLAKRRVAKETIAGLANQGEVGNSNYITNLAEISMPYEAKVVLDLIPKVYDRPGRIAQVLGSDDNARKTVMLNAPFQMDPQTKRPRAVEDPQATDGKVLHYDFSKGKYGFVVEVGKSYKTRLQQGADALGQLIGGAPALMTLLGDIWAQFQDFPGHLEVAKRFKAMLPPQVKQSDEDEDSPEAAQAKLAQAGQMIQQRTEQLQQMQKAIDEEQVQQQAETQRAAMDHETKRQVAFDNNQTKIAIEKIKADLQQALATFEARTSALTREDEQRHDVAMAAAEAEHETRTAKAEAVQAAAMAERDGERTAEEAERGRQATADENERNRQADSERDDDTT
jgi:hypothetical protein